MNYHDGMKFSTQDRDNDVANSYHRQYPGYRHSSDCAEYFKSAWWFKDCYMSNLHGEYFTTSYNRDYKGIHWSTFHPANYTLKATKMMIKSY